MPQLIVNADDFGFSPGVNQGILKAHREGIVSSTTVMVNLDYAEEGVATLLEEAPDIGIGLHINLTFGKPVSPVENVKSLVDDDGHFYLETQLLDVAFSFDSDELYEEIAAQIERFIAIVGRYPTHLDSHYHVAFFHPLALEATVALAAEYNHLPMREIGLHLPAEAMITTMQRFIPELPEEPFLQLIPMLKGIVENSKGIHTPAHFETNFNGDKTTLGDLLNILVSLPEDRPTEIMCHPGLLNDPLNTKAESRQQELDALTHPSAREVIERYNIELINFSHLQYQGENQ